MPVPTSNQGAESQRWLVPLLATSASRHAVGRDVVVTPGPNALLLFGRGHGTWRRRPVRGPAFISPEVSRPNPAGPWFSPQACTPRIADGSGRATRER